MIESRSVRVTLMMGAGGAVEYGIDELTVYPGGRLSLVRVQRGSVRSVADLVFAWACAAARGVSVEDFDTAPPFDCTEHPELRAAMLLLDAISSGAPLESAARELDAARERRKSLERWAAAEEDELACPGCGCRPGDGRTPGCSHPDGCGFAGA